MDEDYDEDEYGALDEGYGSAELPDFQPMEGPGLFDEPEPVAPEQTGPGLYAPEQTGPGLFADDEPTEPEPVTAPSARSAAAAPARAPEAPLALYRRYRPDTFAEVIGQDHVTVPLQRALTNNRVNHAYLFSGPRGCGKTTSARILARCLNCEQGPTPKPCGVCQSCLDLARGGPGSIDVIEIDAASHGGVDDARDLRERAYFAPVASRYKIYIIDEAHMVTPQGFNALLKLVEEPPPHTKFIFATTEPEKVIGTIRSRTHHYPFRLVPPKVLGDYLEHLCEVEGVVVEHSAIPLVVRAGAGSVRDSLSVLDQLLGGAGEDGVSHGQAAALLGYTPDALLDEIMDAFAAGDAAGVFRSVDKVIEVGQDPRRFAEDLLRRLRDLVILAAVPEAATNGILDIAADQAQRLQTQVAGMGAGELTRAAEVIATGLTEMRGTTAPRLHLELMCSRVLLPGADTDERGLHARMDRLERRVGMMGDGQPAPASQWPDIAAAPTQAKPAGKAEHSSPPPPTAAAPRREPAAPESRQQPPAPEAPREAVQEQRAPGQAPRQRPAGAPPVGRGQEMPEPAVAPSAQHGTRPSAPSGQLTAAELRRVWPNVLDEVKRRRRFTHMLLSQHAQVVDVADGALTLGFSGPGPRENFGQGGSVDILADSLIEVIGVELRINPVVSGDTPDEPAPRAQRPSGTPAATVERPEPRPEPAPPVPPPTEPEVSADDEVLDATHNAEELLSNTFAAELISVREAEER
ncbi:DNA polymerase-3 subunit gamma/tau [Tessaracoccus bendigoensis DSM 12906]|uniref:DNA polymerase III subunit gamma/tau n=2 Tax=Tessaracoccus TaxID=72763 RepID=A0A1M6HLY7_9ACTN|nr:DNA polymerase-3 subunit gamma/tau [Tessaracoccus bendigoensis DSM 12906]